MSHSNRKYDQKVEYGSCFSTQQLLNVQSIINNMYYDGKFNTFTILPKLSDIMKSINEKTTNHFGDMEFALNEYGEPDGLKNEQEIVLTVASEVSEEVAEEVFNNIKDLLFKNDHINELAMQLLKESKEK